MPIRYLKESVSGIFGILIIAIVEAGRNGNIETVGKQETSKGMAS